MMQVLIGCMVGGTVGAMAVCLCVAAGQADRKINYTNLE
ncbi:MAG: DUF3789 domain-containing protein [Oscillospiraceae bacterium]|nr:DUF3789 domain-containing protein [Oscillospiraceae bacterium]